MKIRVLAAIVLAVVAFVVSSAESEKEQQTDGAAALADAIELVSIIEPYEANRDYIDDVIRQAHERSFDLTYRKGMPGGRRTSRTPGELRHDDYLKWLFQYAKRQIRDDYNDTGKRETIRRLKRIEKALEALRDENGIENFGS